MKNKLTNLALVFGAACTLTSCNETKEAVAGAEMASDMADKVTGADSQEKVVDDAIKLMGEGMELMASGDEEAAKKAMATIQEKGKALEERAKALGLDINDPSSLPDELKTKIENATKELQAKAQAMMAEQMKKAMEDAAGQ